MMYSVGRRGDRRGAAGVGSSWSVGAASVWWSGAAALASAGAGGGVGREAHQTGWLAAACVAEEVWHTWRIARD